MKKTKANIIQNDSTTIVEAVLRDSGDEETSRKVRITISILGIGVYFDGFGAMDAIEGEGEPVYIEIYDGIPKVFVWGDINEEEPTDIIGLENAAETERVE